MPVGLETLVGVYRCSIVKVLNQESSAAVYLAYGRPYARLIGFREETRVLPTLAPISKDGRSDVAVRRSHLRGVPYRVGFCEPVRKNQPHHQ